FGDESMKVSHSLSGLSADLFIAEGKKAEAEAVAREALTIARKLGGEHSPGVIIPLRSLGTAFFEQGKFAEAEAVFREGLELERNSNFGSSHPQTAIRLSALATTLRLQGKFAEAEPLYRECLAIREKKVPDAWYTYYTRAMLGEAMVGQSRYAEA